MKILIIPSWYPNSFNSLNGIFFKEQAEALVKYGHVVSVIYIYGYHVNKIRKHKNLVLKSNNSTENGVDTYIAEYPALPKLHTLREKINLYFFKKKFEAYRKKNGLPSIVHVHSYAAGKFALWVQKNYNIPYIVTEHVTGFARGVVSKPRLEVAKQIFRHSKANIAVSREYKKLLESMFDVEFEYIPNIVDTEFFGLKSKDNDGIYKFINIAFLGTKKNQSMLIEAFAKAFRSQNITLTIVGDGPEYEHLSSLIKQLNIQDQITLYGRAKRQEVKELLQKSDAFVLSSRYETFGVVAIEAMACGLPVVATKCGGPESIVQSQSVGVLSDIDEESLAESMKYLYENRDSYDAEYISQYTKYNFSEDVVCEKLTKLYGGIVDVN